MNQSSIPLDRQVARVRHTLYWVAGTATATGLLWAVGDPWLVDHFGVEAPWWVYLLLCMRLVGGVVQICAQDSALRMAWREEDEAALSLGDPDAKPVRDFQHSAHHGLGHGA